MPNAPKTPIRAIRIDDELWQQVREKCRTDGTTASEVVRRLLVDWLGT